MAEKGLELQEIGVPNEAVIDVGRVSKSFKRGTRVLDDVSFAVGRREMVALIGASGSGNVTRVSSISVTRITSGIGSSTTSITAVSTADDASCVCGLTPFRLVTRFRSFFAANVFAVFLDFLPTARLTDFLPAWVRLETFAFVFRTIALRSLGHR